MYSSDAARRATSEPSRQVLADVAVLVRHFAERDSC
jgi:hypothetical protein